MGTLILMFAYSYNKMIRKIYGQEIQRPGDLGVTTVYQRLVDYNKAVSWYERLRTKSSGGFTTINQRLV
jgi:hypothetical protein